ncbi:hypothetical protein NQ314_008089, partial [Rhamnusium bicolor]
MHGNADALSRMYKNDEHFVDVTFEEFVEYRKEHVIPEPQNVKIIEGDLFLAPVSSSLAHCVSQDFRMGKGIAKEFKKKYGREDELKNQNKTIGEVAEIRQEGRNVYYLVTKRWYNEKPRYEDLWKALKTLRRRSEENGDKQIAMPKIGCGLDGLLWEESRVNRVEKEDFVPVWDKNIIREAQRQDVQCKLITT